MLIQVKESIKIGKYNILIPLVWVSPKIFLEADNLSKISWTAVSTDSHSTFVITSNIERVTSTSRCLKVFQGGFIKLCSKEIGK